MDLKKKPDTRGAATSLLKISDILLQTLLVLDELFTIVGQSSYATNITRNRYLKEVTIFRGRPYDLKALAVTYLSSSAANLRIFHSAPQGHCAVRLCVPFRAFHGTSMSHRGHRGWGRFPSSNITMVSLIFRCQNFIIHLFTTTLLNTPLFTRQPFTRTRNSLSKSS